MGSKKQDQARLKPAEGDIEGMGGLRPAFHQLKLVANTGRLKPAGNQGSGCRQQWAQGLHRDTTMAKCVMHGPVWRLVSLHVSSGTGQLRLLLYIPDRSKQHGRRLPLASMSHAVAIRFTRVSGRLGEVIQ